MSLTVTMRGWSVVLAAACALVVGLPRAAGGAQLPAGTSVSGHGGSIGYSVGGSSSTWDPGRPGASGGGGAPAGGASGGGAAAQSFPAPVLLVQGTDAGGKCLEVSSGLFPTPEAAAAAQVAFQLAWYLLTGTHAFCALQSPPAGEAATPAPAAVPSPGTLATTFWERSGVDHLPTPEPSIRPGYALAGNPGYLQASAPMTATFAHQTPLGTLTISASATMWVDWGDSGTWSGPYASPGMPWPYGDVTHVWDDTGTYDVQVQYRWGATWSLGRTGGSLSGLSTSGSIPAFQVEELRSVRNR